MKNSFVFFLFFVFLSLCPKEKSFAGGMKCEDKLKDEFSCSKLQKQKEFSFSDGTKMVNPIYLINENALSSVEDQNEVESLELDIQVLFQQSLDESKNRFSPRFRAAVMAQLGSRVDFLFDEENEFNIQGVPWPADDPKAPLKNITAKEMRTFLVKTLPRSALQEIKQKIRLKNQVGRGLPKELRTSLAEAQNQAPSLDKEKENRRINGLLQNVKNSLIRRISKGKPTASLSEEERSLINRISTVKLAVDGASQYLSCENSPNAFYSPTSHEITVCPGFYGYPEVSLVQVLAHEISHSIDPCRSQFSLIKPNEELLFGSRRVEGDEGFLGEANFGSSIRSSRRPFSDHQIHREEIIGQIKLGAQDSEYVNTNFMLSFSDSIATLKSLEKEGYFNEVSPKVSADRYPLRRQVQCLKEHGFRSGLNGSIDDELKEYYRSFPREQRKNELAQTKKKLEEYKECVHLNRKSEMNEAISDQLAVDVVADYYSAHPPKGKDDFIGSHLFFILKHCSESNYKKYLKEPSQSSNLLELSESIASSVQDQLNLEHPPDMERLNKLYLGNERIGKIFGCEPNESKECFDRYPFFKWGSDLTEIKKLSTKGVK